MLPACIFSGMTIGHREKLRIGTIAFPGKTAPNGWLYISISYENVSKWQGL